MRSFGAEGGTLSHLRASLLEFLVRQAAAGEAVYPARQYHAGP